MTLARVAGRPYHAKLAETRHVAALIDNIPNTLFKSKLPVPCKSGNTISLHNTSGLDIPLADWFHTMSNFGCSELDVSQ